MAGPILFPIVLGIAGWFAGDVAGAIVGAAVGGLLSLSVMVAAIWWSRTIGDLLDPADAWEHAPRPPGFGRLTEWVYRRTIPSSDEG